MLIVRFDIGSDSRLSPLIHFKEFCHRLDVVTLVQSILSLHLLQTGRGKVIPAWLCGESIPDGQIIVVRSPAVRVAPFKNLLVRATFEHPFFQCVVFHSEKAQAPSISTLAKIRMKSGVQFSGCVKSDFIEHSGKISHAPGFLVGADWLLIHRLSRVLKRRIKPLSPLLWSNGGFWQLQPTNCIFVLLKASQCEPFQSLEDVLQRAVGCY